MLEGRYFPKEKPKKEESKEPEKKKESHVEYQERIGVIKNDIVCLGERNMDNTVRVIRRWINGDMRIINKGIVDKFGKNPN